MKVWEISIKPTKEPDDPISSSSDQQVPIVVEGGAVYGYWFWFQRELELGDNLKY